jgi:hypothetical protein
MSDQPPSAATSARTTTSRSTKVASIHPPASAASTPPRRSPRPPPSQSPNPPHPRATFPRTPARLDPLPQAHLDQHVSRQEAARPRRLEALQEARQYLRPRRSRPHRRRSRSAGCRRGESGKTHLASSLNVPLAIGDATSLTEARTWRACPSSCFKQPRAMGIVYIDEVDKLRGLGSSTPEARSPRCHKAEAARRPLRHDQRPLHLRRGVRRAGKHHRQEARTGRVRVRSVG